ncbi:hypothetical protein M3685_03400 [Heyndrickxia oleronia]|uniref:hypothetical protein n=1 Tax=Heyndrickxia TaxID=2837504 RepID=UPI001C0EB375|nr:hypothetical protein [Heyndrickxia oleronia]MBU5211766.1 hypothetical protein [Heyndrickxia oleronia]MCM3452975.1 hypothetical protein [Heyndrickxia oleronia]
MKKSLVSTATGILLIACLVFTPLATSSYAYQETIGGSGGKTPPKCDNKGNCVVLG